MLRQAEAANEAHIAAFEALGELGTSGLSQGHGGVGPGPRVIPPKYPSGPPPPPPPPSGPPEAPGGGFQNHQVHLHQVLLVPGMIHLTPITD